MKVKIKKLHPEAVIPKYAKEGDAGLDLVATSLTLSDHKNCQCTYGTGLAVEIPLGYVGLIFPRSSIFKPGMVLSNCVGVIDSGYRGEIKFVFDHLYDRPTYQVGDKIGQLIIMPYPQVEFEEASELSDSSRGTSGFGSTGK